MAFNNEIGGNQGTDRFIYKANEDSVLGYLASKPYGLVQGILSPSLSLVLVHSSAPDSRMYFEIWYRLINQSTTDTVDPWGGYYCGSDGAQASLSPNLVWNKTTIAAKGDTGWFGPFSAYKGPDTGDNITMSMAVDSSENDRCTWFVKYRQVSGPTFGPTSQGTGN